MNYIELYMSKIKTIFKEGIKTVAEAYAEGKYNFEHPTPEIELLAKQRLKGFKGLEREPISFLRVKDERIPELSEMMVSSCGCCAPYKFRQNIIKDEQWQS